MNATARITMHEAVLLADDYLRRLPGAVIVIKPYDVAGTLLQTSDSTTTVQPRDWTGKVGARLDQ